LLAAILLVLTTAGAGFADRPPQEEDRADVAALVASQSDFAFALYARLSGANEGQDLFFSPSSLATALTMAAEGARGETAEGMGKALRFPEAARRTGADAARLPWDTARLHAAADALRRQVSAGSQPPPPQVRARIETLRDELQRANKLAARMRDLDEKKHTEAALRSQELARELNALLPRYEQYELRAANALWGEKTYPFRESYQETLARYYGTGGLFPADFRNDAAGARREINAWVAEQTGDRVQDLIGPDLLGPRTSLVLTNAVYFKGRWAEEFDPGETHPDDFLLAGGGKARVPLMRRASRGAARYAAFQGDGTFFDTPAEVVEGEKDQSKLYPGEQGFLMLELPYKGHGVSLVLLAPRSADGLASLEKQLTTSHFRAWADQLRQRAVHVFLPRFKLEAAYDLGEALKGMGMEGAFKDPTQPAGADFGGMSASTDPRQQLFLSKVLHKTFLEVNEKGTEAAAATAVMVERPSERPPPRMVPFTPTFRADRPFMFLIRHRQTGSILFLGRVTNPGNKR
jgi:serine protease inhibitor